VAGLLLAASSAFELPAETFEADVDAEMLLDAAILSDVASAQARTAKPMQTAQI
jgi:hypothetical protein